ncbi:hemerythrin domain-containing protein [Cocleimonas sp. KMM 6892]|uniref:hemerythrin domain-containing protein n=1 Tax=unclassified Cocleimonas TaxID=2639732 RepID=UPI002DB7379A|nr:MULTISPECIES: hemerythrin domain-containing protein [unclassified Cocleimonas]MEB8431604.1 hemerythrin domain-containing protein [Cocleimonas sp. KMM 6892]MEC4713624.1 hemerythrin domain-containing protein [Cocleimonas sp. KMM 6895]MEC4742955.1 hemerythrin domain-containing protein [Cocleimonas sp. KMM 6896]
MKRAEQLQDLSREHHGSLVMAKRIAEVAESGDEAAIAEAIEKVKDYYENELEVHFQHEERTIFAPIFKEYREHIGIATQLLKEHGAMRMLMPKLHVASAREDLAEFASMLKNHTRIEERELFPIVESIFSDEQLDAILNFVPLD